MAFKLTKAEMAARDEHAAALESEAGEQANEMANRWEYFQPEELEMFNVETFECPDACHYDELNELPEDKESA